jgi:dihydropteroate synthase
VASGFRGQDARGHFGWDRGHFGWDRGHFGWDRGHFPITLPDSRATLIPMSLPPPAHWQLRTRRLELPHPGGLLRRPLVMGIVNVTPDSFSDGGRFAEVEAAVAHGLQLEAAGADILDIGGESTRPSAEPVAEAEELARVAEVVRRLAAESGLPVSIDTSKAAVAARAVALGAEIINDVTGLEGDPAMPAVARESGAGLCVMHMQGTPQTMQDDPRYGDVVAEIHAYLRQRRDALEATGIPRARICLDPGIGFGKTHAHNLALMGQAGRFLDLGCPVLVGHSRKGFIGKALERALGRPATEADRDAGTAGAACGLAAAGVQLIRVHAVGLVRAALEAFAATSDQSAGLVK